MRTTAPPTERPTKMTNDTANDMTTEIDKKVNSISTNSDLVVSSVLSEQVYHEMADKPVTRVDPWEQLQMNIETLQDLQSRYSFVLREVRYLIKA